MEPPALPTSLDDMNKGTPGVTDLDLEQEPQPEPEPEPVAELDEPTMHGTPVKFLRYDDQGTNTAASPSTPHQPRAVSSPPGTEPSPPGGSSTMSSHRSSSPAPATIHVRAGLHDGTDLMDSQPVVFMEGRLKKHWSGTRSSSKSRYFTLRSSPSGVIELLYTKKQEATPKENHIIQMADITNVYQADDAATFCVECPHNEQDTATLHLTADSREEAEKWFRELGFRKGLVENGADTASGDEGRSMQTTKPRRNKTPSNGFFACCSARSSTSSTAAPRSALPSPRPTAAVPISATPSSSSRFFRSKSKPHPSYPDIDLTNSTSKKDKEMLRAIFAMCEQLKDTGGAILKDQSVEDMLVAATASTKHTAAAAAVLPGPGPSSEDDALLVIDGAVKESQVIRADLLAELDASIVQATAVEDEHKRTQQSFRTACQDLLAEAEKISESHRMCKQDMEAKRVEIQQDIEQRQVEVQDYTARTSAELAKFFRQQADELSRMKEQADQDLKQERQDIKQRVMDGEREIRDRAQAEDLELRAILDTMRTAKEQLDAAEQLKRTRCLEITRAAQQCETTMVQIEASGRQHRWQVRHVIYEPDGVLAQAYHEAHQRGEDSFPIEPRHEEAFERINRYWRYYVEHDERQMPFSEILYRLEDPLRVVAEDARIFGLRKFQAQCEEFIRTNADFVEELRVHIQDIDSNLTDAQQAVQSLAARRPSLSGHKPQLEQLRPQLESAKKAYFADLLYDVRSKQFAKSSEKQDEVATKFHVFFERDSEGFLHEWRALDADVKEQSDVVARDVAAALTTAAQPRQQRCSLDRLKQTLEDIDRLKTALFKVGQSHPAVLAHLNRYQANSRFHFADFVQSVLGTNTAEPDLEAAVLQSAREEHARQPHGGDAHKELGDAINHAIRQTEQHKSTVDDCLSRFEHAARLLNEPSSSMSNGSDTPAIPFAEIKSLFSDLETHRGRLRDQASIDELRHHLSAKTQSIAGPVKQKLKEHRYSDISRRMQTLADFRQIGDVPTCKQSEKELQAIKHDVSAQQERMQTHLKTLYQRALESVSLADDGKLLKDIRINLSALQEMDKHLLRRYPSDFEALDEDAIRKMFHDSTDENAQKAWKTIFDHGGGFQSDEVMQRVANAVMTFYRVPSDVPVPGVAEHAFGWIDKILTELVQRNASIELLAEALENKGQRGTEIVNGKRFGHFRDWRIRQMKKKTAQFTPEHCLQQLERDNESFTATDRQEFQRLHAKYHKFYEESIQAAILERPRPPPNDFAKQLLTKSGDDMVLVLASVCAVWSFVDCPESSFDTVEPHPVQIIAVFRLLSLHTKGSTNRKSFTMSTLDSWLMQVKTGQGKSVLLGVLATTLALTGHDVDCVCYSKYLSRRDFANFQPLFQAFAVERQIEYGTIDELAKKTLIQQHGDVQQSTHELFNGSLKPSIKQQSAADRRPKVLLVDEVDVFLSSKFYGQLYIPVTKPDHMRVTSQIGDIQEFIWEQTKQGKSGIVQQLRSQDSYRQLMEFDKHLKSVFDGHITQMIHDAGIVHNSNLGDDGVFTGKLHSRPRAGVPSEHSEQHLGMGPEPEPEPESGACCEKILYPDQDQESSSMYFGYETTFCYFKARDHQRLMDMEAAKGLRVACGRFSYAEMTRTGAGRPYACMLGVTGTLDAMGQFEQQVVREDFGIQHLEKAPSMYGDSKLDFAPSLRADHVTVEKDLASQQLAVCQQINEKVANGGVVLVFFDTEAKLTQFKESQYWSTRNEAVIAQYMTTDFNQERIDTAVRLAARPSTVTLLTREHGRGLDFEPGREVNETGGMHVIQTFFSKELAEEVQIKGRTARQDRKGSYRMVLLASDLEAWSELGIADAVARCHDLHYAELDERRRRCCEQDVQNRQEQVKSAKGQHDESLQLARHLRDAAIEQACAYLSQHSSYQRASATSIRFVVDISGSMGWVYDPKRRNVCGAKGIKKSYSGPPCPITSCVDAMAYILNEFIHSHDHVAITLFDNKIYANELPWTQKGGNEETIEAAIRKCERTGGTTYLWDAINSALDNPPPDHAGPYWIFVLTDGADSGSKKITHRQLVAKTTAATSSGSLGGLIGLPAGNSVDAETQQNLMELVTASGLDEGGLIPSGDTTRIRDAFARAATIMNDHVAGRA